MNLAGWVERNGRAFPERPGISLGTHVHASFCGWARTIRVLGGNLRDRLRLRPGDRAAIVMTNRPEYLEALFGALHAGLTAVPMNAKLHRNEFEYMLGHSGSRVAFVSPDLAETMAPLADTVDGLERVIVTGSAEWRQLLSGEGAPIVPRAPDDPAWLFYTSGTTGRPKGATLTHRNLLMCSLSYHADIDFLGPEDCSLHAAPLSHGSGLYAFPHIAKAANSIVPESHGFDPAEIVDLLRHWRGMSFFAAPTMLTRLIASPAFASADHRNLKCITYGGAPM
jgi:acyl-CoA synthetase (AMP-forming)/AMP-acid ligase II